jgi:hypothetical protein
LDISGLRGPFECLNKARYGISWGVVGAMENMINTTIDYTGERKQFSKSLDSFQLVQNDLVKCIELYSCSLNNLFSSTNAIDEFTDLEKNIALISFLKRTNCENALIVARLCRDMLGGNGVSNSYNIIRHMINLEAVNTYEGTKNIHNLTRIIIIFINLLCSIRAYMVTKHFNLEDALNNNELHAIDFEDFEEYKLTNDSPQQIIAINKYDKTVNNIELFEKIMNNVN